MLGVLVRIARKLAVGKRGGVVEEGMRQLQGREGDLRKRILAAGVEAIAERGSLGARAIEVIWECIVGWDEDLMDIEGVELKNRRHQDSGAEVISSLPLEFLLGQIVNTLSVGAFPPESLSQLLAILHRLAQHDNALACTIMTTPGLVSTIIDKFLLTPIPTTDTYSMPDPSALQLLTTLALASRSNALALLEPTDSLLRFVTMLPPASLYPAPLATALLTSTLRFYSALASYGLYTHIATVAAVQFSQVGSYVLSEECRSRRLMSAWAGLMEAWTVCATDPHRTTPSHDILWSQVVGWGWKEDLWEAKGRLAVGEEDWEAWGAVWKAEGAWLEGARVNSVRAGEKERLAAVELLKGGFEAGKEKDVVWGAIGALHRGVNDNRWKVHPTSALGILRSMAAHANTLMSAIRLWLACLPPPADGVPASPPFSLPFQQISELCAKLVAHPLWVYVYSEDAPAYAHVFCRALTALLSFYLRLSRRLPGIGGDLWMTQGFSILGRLIPGDEEFGLQMMEDLIGLVNKNFLASRGWVVPSVIWEKGGMAVIKPFLMCTVRPKDDVYLGPTCMSPQSVLLSTTQRLPSRGLPSDSGLPLSRDWTLSPLDHLLRSGTSPVFKALPLSWDASETEVVRGSLLLAKVAREVLHRYALRDFMLTREETVLGCMKIFMLEHGQAQSDSADEVFRDSVVGQYAHDLLAPFTYAAAPSSHNIAASTHGGLEIAAAQFLGTSTPFYQYYTDFVALYDAVSFSQPLFSRLLIPPLSMQYAPDYRKHLWNDFGHVLRTVRTPIHEVVASDLGEYLWPVESDPLMISSYLRALVKGPLDGFMRFLAVHHIACNVWPDLQGVDGSNDRGEKLLKAVVSQGGDDVVREVVRYRQAVGEGRSAVVVPPKCFEGDGIWRVLRLECVGRWGGLPLVERLRGLFV
jgi:hypothetical protein